MPPQGSLRAKVYEAAHHYPKVEGYVITHLLGQGGMGVVYRAVQTKLNRIVALKVLPAIVASPSAVERFRREARAAARLHHTHIVPIYDFGESHDGYFYAMELIEGQPLNELIKTFARHDISTASAARLATVLHHGTTAMPAEAEAEGLLAPSSSTVASSSTGRGRAYYQQVARWMADAADALHYAHGQGIIHRDIKPGNMILSSDGRIMIADFGLAKCSGDESVTITGALLGAIRYVSPEQAMAKRIRVDHRTDIYSLGATMFELLTFQPAFPGNDEKEILAAIITRDPARPRKIVHTVPQELETICLKTLEKRPDLRYDTARALAEDLRRFLHDQPIIARRPGPLARVHKFVRRHKAPVIAVTAVVLLVVSMLVIQRLTRINLDERILALKATTQSLVEGKQWGAADVPLREALRLDLENLNSWLFLAWMKLEHHAAKPDEAGTKALEEVERACRRVLDKEPNNDTALGYLGVARQRLKRYPEALEALERASRLAPDDYSHWSNLGAVHLVLHHFENAEQCLRRAGELVDQDAENANYRAMVWRNLAVFELFQKKPEAFEHVKNAVELDGHDVLAWVIRVRIELEMQDPINARQAVDHAKHADLLGKSHHPKAKRILALAYLRNQEFDEAVNEARAAIALNDMPTVNHLIIAVAEAKRGQPAAAREAVAAAKTAWPEELRSPGSFTPFTNIAELWIESADDLLGLKAEAEAAIAAASGSQPQPPLPVGEGRGEGVTPFPGPMVYGLRSTAFREWVPGRNLDK